MSSAARRPVASQPSTGAAALAPSGLSPARRAELRRKYPGAFSTDPPEDGETAASIAKECEQLRREIAADREAAAMEREITRLQRATTADRMEAARDAEIARLQREVNEERAALARERAALAAERGDGAARPARIASTEHERFNRRNGISAARSEALRRRYPGAFAQGERP